MSTRVSFSSLLPVTIGALAMVGALSAGCSVIFHVDASQCSTTPDCTGRGAAFAGYTCKAGQCLPPTPPDGGDGGKVRQCNVNSDCKSDSGSHPEVVCDVDTFTCVQLTTDECPILLPAGQLNSNSTSPPIFIGAFGVVPPTNPLGHPTTLNYNLAVSEFLPPAGLAIPAGPPPPPASRTPMVVECDVAADINKAMDHLVNDVGVTTVVAPLPSATLATTFQTYDINSTRNIFFINPLSADSNLLQLPTNGLLWHMLGLPGDVAPAYKAFMPVLENRIRNTAPWNLGPTAPLRVTVVTANAISTNDLAKAVKDVLVWNGVNVTANTPNNFQEIIIPTNDTFLNNPKLDLKTIDWTDDLNAIYNFQPHVIISFASEEFVSLLENVEIGWSSSAPQPFYLVGPYNMGSTELQTDMALYNYAPGTSESVDSLRVRTAGVGVASTTKVQVLNDYETRFLAANNQNTGALGEENYYDSMYFAIYSMVAAGRQTGLTGLEMSRGMKHLVNLPPAAQYDVGPADQGNIFGALGVSGNIGLTGALGPPDFDLTTGSRIGAGSIYCINRVTTDAGSLQFPYAYDVLTLGTTGADGGTPLVGTFPCFGLN